MTERIVIPKLFAARRAQKMIGQEEAWEELQAAIAPTDHSFRVVLLRAEGGMGKTRLLEEVLLSHGRQVYDWEEPQLMEEAELGDPVIADLIDVIDTRLHDRYRFIRALRESLRAYGGDADFSGFDAADNSVRELAAKGALLDAMTEAENKAVDKFVEDLQKLAAGRRVVFMVDTVERLRYRASRRYAGSELFLQKGLLEPDDVEIRTHHWLLRFVSKYNLENVTLILAGRGREGEEFFDRVEEKVDATALESRDCRLIPINLKRLSINQTRAYLAQLAEDWSKEGPEYRTVADNFALAAREGYDQHKVIALYTAGVPIRLALYAQVIAEGKTIPAAFRLSFREACLRAGLHPNQVAPDAELSDVVTPELKQIQWEVEEEFIRLIFDAPGDRRSAVLRALVRAPRGLTARQLHYALDAAIETDPATWEKDLHRREAALAELVDLLEDIARDYLGKRRSPLEALPEELDDTVERASTYRTGLQDEIYRIYAEHMGLLAEPVSEETELVRAQLSEEKRNQYTRNQIVETEARRTLYHKLADYAEYQHGLLLGAKREYMRQDEIRFEEKFSLSDPKTYEFEDLPLTEEIERQNLYAAITVYEIEHMVYRILENPQRNINLDYIAPENDNDKAARQEEDFWAQSEMWQVLHDDGLMKFAEFPERAVERTRNELPIDVLRRVAEQENVSRWIKRFVLRGKTDRAIEFGTRVDELIYAWPRPEGDDDDSTALRNKWGSWNHTLAHEERVIWTQFAFIRRGADVPEATDKIRDSIRQLEKLFKTDVKHVAIEEEGRKEYGFAGIPDGSKPAHPAFTRLRRLLSHAHNHLGFGLRTMGHMHAAVEHYGTALEYIRTDRELMRAHRAKVLNNLARALSELGWNSISVCLDGRDLRWRLAEEVPLAGSYNTLALIYDDMGRYEDAPLLSAKAIAYCRRAQENRQLGLSLRQMGESLRHVAERVRTRQRLAGVPDIYLKAAEKLLRDAWIIFEGLGEVERLIEVNLELGSLYRDQMQPAEYDDYAQPLRMKTRAKIYELALSSLSTAERDAKLRKLGQHELDAQINRARVYLFAGETNKARAILEGIETNPNYVDHVITEDYLPNARLDELRDRNWVFRHLGTARMIRGWMAVDRFTERTNELKLDNPIDEEDPDTSHAARNRVIEADPAAQEALATVAECYALGIAYAELYSPRSRSIGTMQNDLYSRLRKFNRAELESFRIHLEAVGAKYRKIDSVRMLLLFLDEFFGPKLT